VNVPGAIRLPEIAPLSVVPLRDWVTVQLITDAGEQVTDASPVAFDWENGQVKGMGKLAFAPG